MKTKSVSLLRGKLRSHPLPIFGVLFSPKFPGRPGPRAIDVVFFLREISDRFFLFFSFFFAMLLEEINSFFFEIRSDQMEFIIYYIQSVL